MKDVVVIGGSLAGLMNAIVLKELGYHVHVLERSNIEALQSEAAGIRSGPEVHSFIERYVKNYLNYAITVETVEIWNEKSEVLSTFPPTTPLRLTTWKALYDMFKSVLLDSGTDQSPAKYETRQLVQDVQYEGNKLSVKYRDLDNEVTKTLEADLVIAADGANSAVRNMFSQSSSPKYAGYVTWRGRVPEGAVDTKTREALRNRCVVLRVDGGYLISYYVPADTGDRQGSRCDFVWIWYDYDRFPEDSSDFHEIMTDVDGRKHFTTIPRGRMQPKVWRSILDRKSVVSNPHFVELLEKTKEPFVSAIRDFPGSKAVFCDGKLLLVGDALALCRPHGGGSTSQAAFQALELGKVWEGARALDLWEKDCLEGASKAQTISLAMGEFFFAGKAPTVVRNTVESDSQ
ncbi:FAD/NAD(P)-binding domain-containing protein [Melanomma pulvis-pyrius CBS 109.77]|uniref:FAD/NAD(P)-binding domain-containing protein n=1 Tax=Melanomma pulvis-pyrius CBS 109.77 TaxID=1314802 RepID=A0A6A6WNM9_9PLEO|nr:FAD/NAD(P)-binding domain-containing protein [Melanomma pulvis-pyrius CBS 109.77]